MLGSGIIFWPPGTHGYPGGDGVVFHKDPKQLKFGFVSVQVQYMESKVNFYMSKILRVIGPMAYKQICTKFGSFQIKF